MTLVSLQCLLIYRFYIGWFLHILALVGSITSGENTRKFLWFHVLDLFCERNNLWIFKIRSIFSFLSLWCVGCLRQNLRAKLVDLIWSFANFQLNTTLIANIFTRIQIHFNLHFTAFFANFLLLWLLLPRNFECISLTHQRICITACRPYTTQRVSNLIYRGKILISPFFCLPFSVSQPKIFLLFNSDLFGQVLLK